MVGKFSDNGKIIINFAACMHCCEDESSQN
uniref:Uncharacterized protein n=1 Tax=Rhizophora mucronata TaxID=61149 RepID=A0A2P2NR62_RHIMU